MRCLWRLRWRAVAKRRHSSTRVWFLRSPSHDAHTTVGVWVGVWVWVWVWGVGGGVWHGTDRQEMHRATAELLSVRIYNHIYLYLEFGVWSLEVFGFWFSVFILSFLRRPNE